jgi:hypothetical protein
MSSSIPTIRLSPEVVAHVARRVARRLNVPLSVAQAQVAKTLSDPANTVPAFTPAAAPAPSGEALTLRQAMQRLRQRHPGVDDSALAERAERLVAQSAARHAVAMADKTTAPPAADGVVVGSTRRLVMDLVRRGHSHEAAMRLASSSKRGEILSDDEEEVEAAARKIVDDEGCTLDEAKSRVLAARRKGGAK